LSCGASFTFPSAPNCDLRSIAIALSCRECGYVSRTLVVSSDVPAGTATGRNRNSDLETLVRRTKFACSSNLGRRRMPRIALLFHHAHAIPLEVSSESARRTRIRLFLHTLLPLPDLQKVGTIGTISHLQRPERAAYRRV
jgi:hypothetical protein